jgi:hypothetical protein
MFVTLCYQAIKKAGNSPPHLLTRKYIYEISQSTFFIKYLNITGVLFGVLARLLRDIYKIMALNPITH